MKLKWPKFSFDYYIVSYFGQYQNQINSRYATLRNSTNKHPRYVTVSVFYDLIFHRGE